MKVAIHNNRIEIEGETQTELDFLYRNYWNDRQELIVRVEGNGDRFGVIYTNGNDETKDDSK